MKTRDIIPLHAPALFDPIAKGGYRIMLVNIIAYRNNQAAAEEGPQQWDPQVPAPQQFDMGPHGFFDYWLITKLGQKPKLGGVRIPTDITFMFTHFIPVVGVHTFSLYYPC